MRRASHPGGLRSRSCPPVHAAARRWGGGQILTVRISPLGTVVQPRRFTSWRCPSALPRDRHTEQRSVPVKLLRDAMLARSRAALPRRYPGVKRRLQAVRFRHFWTIQHLTIGDVLGLLLGCGRAAAAPPPSPRARAALVQHRLLRSRGSDQAGVTRFRSAHQRREQRQPAPCPLAFAGRSPSPREICSDRSAVLGLAGRAAPSTRSAFRPEPLWQSSGRDHRGHSMTRAHVAVII